MARPSATRWRSPPDRPETGWSSRCVDAQDARRLLDALRGSRARAHALAFQRKADVLAHVHVRIEREQLEHEGDVARRRAPQGDVLAVEQDLPGGRQLEPGDHAQASSSCRSPTGPSRQKNVAVARP